MSNSKKKEQRPEKLYEIVEYDDVIKREDYEKMYQHFDEIDRFRSNIVLALVELFDRYTKKEIGSALALSLLYKLESRVKKKINLAKVKIPDIANVEFAMVGKLNNGGRIILSKEASNKFGGIKSERIEEVEKYERYLEGHLKLSLQDLLINIEGIINQVKNLNSFPEIDDWYPKIKANSSVNKQIEIFVNHKFKPKSHSKEMIISYLKRWMENQGVNYPRKVTLEELKSEYPKLSNISGSVILNWEENWEEFRISRTEG